MFRSFILTTMAVALGAVLSQVSADDGEQQLLATAQQLFKPLPADFATADRPLTPAKVELGRMLFFENRVSLDGTMSCAACHPAALYGADGLPKSFGILNRALPRNAATVLNTAGQFAQHFGGNRKDVEEQAMRALLSPFAYGNPDYPTAMSRLKAIPGYTPVFQAAFPNDADPFTAENWAAAIGAYERTLVSPSPFDRYLAGDNDAIPPAARRGLDTFISTGCVGCHNGVLIGGTMFQRFALMGDYWTFTKSAEVDKGRFVDTKNEADSFMFKVPPLRNIARTPPYFHDGSVATLPEAVRVMGAAQLGKQLSDTDIASIVAFLESLTGTIPANFREAPILPPGPFVALPAK